MEVEYLLFLDNLKDVMGEFLTSVMGFLSNFGSERYFIAITAFVYWCLNKKYGIFAILCFGITGFLNSILKLTFCIYRPYLLDERLYHFPKADGYSFPSGHASNAAGYLFPIGRCYKKTKIVPALSFLGVVAVCLSRNFLGVHTLKDVLAGVLLGVICLIVTEHILKQMKKLKYGVFILFVMIILLSALAVTFVNHKSYPNDMNAYGELLVDPKRSFGDLYGRIGLLFGAITGSVFEKKLIKFDVPDKFICKILYYIFGIHLVAGLDRVLVNNSSFKEMFNKFVLMFFITAIFPIVIKFCQRVIIKGRS